MTTLRAKFFAQCPTCGGVIRRGELITSWTDPDGTETWVHTQQCAAVVGAAVPDRIGASRTNVVRRRRRKQRGA